MITSSLIYSREQSVAILEAPDQLDRRDAHFRVSAQDLAAFGRCPFRWFWGAPPEDPLLANGPTLTEWLAFDPGLAERFLIRRPETYEAMRLECPGCGSEGPAKSCTKCGRLRKNVVRPRPWNSSAKICAHWAMKAEQAGQRVVSPNDYERAKMGAHAVLADPAVQELMPDSPWL